MLFHLEVYMENCVIYPRFSSHGQNEQSIEAQIRICKEFAKSKGLNVVNIYPEKAKTGTNDNRPKAVPFSILLFT